MSRHEKFLQHITWGSELEIERVTEIRPMGAKTTNKPMEEELKEIKIFPSYGQ